MARTVTRLQLQNRAYQLSNMESHTTLWPTTDVQERINTHLTECFDLFRAASPPDYYSNTQTVSVTASTSSYSLNSDFLDLQGVYVEEGATDRLRPIRSLRPGERSLVQAPTTSATIYVEYTPTPTSLSADGSTFDGVNGWDELIVNLVARDMLKKTRESTEQMDQSIAEMRARIKAMAYRDKGGPRYVRDVEEEDATPLYLNSIACYRLRAGNIEIYESGWSWL